MHLGEPIEFARYRRVVVIVFDSSVRAQHSIHISQRAWQGHNKVEGVTSTDCIKTNGRSNETKTGIVSRNIVVLAKNFILPLAC